ncbi:MAG: hypothetical protein Kow0026_08550 [Oricola sp.]
MNIAANTPTDDEIDDAVLEQAVDDVLAAMRTAPDAVNRDQVEAMKREVEEIEHDLQRLDAEAQVKRDLLYKGIDAKIEKHTLTIAKAQETIANMSRSVADLQAEKQEGDAVIRRDAAIGRDALLRRKRAVEAFLAEMSGGAKR